MFDGARTPRYELRTRLTLSEIDRLEPQRVLEAGCGDGALLVQLAKRGIHAVGVEPGNEAYARATALTEGYPSVAVVSSWSSKVGEDFDCLVALEVLEHLEDDLNSLKRWVSHLRPGGTVIVSVPAHMHLWSEVDVAVGHHRRYSRSALERLLSQSGLSEVRVWSYGFPLTTITRLRRRRHTDCLAHGETPAVRTLHSAAVSHTGLGTSSLTKLLLRGAGFAGHIAQLPFRRTDLGDGWIGIGKKPRP